MNNRKTNYVIAFMITIAAVLFDQFTKHLAVVNLKNQNPYVIWENVFELQYLENRGAAFGMLQNKQMFFLFMVRVITAFIIYFYQIIPMTNYYLPLRACMVFIVSGALGNCIDRVSNHYVVDFFYFKLINFPIFNVADIYVTCATAGLLFLFLFYYKEEDLEKIIHSRKRGF